ncbi:MAG: PilZ domain-containing protein [Xanthobacteraceae bacterium]|jgi:PilZ domain
MGREARNTKRRFISTGARIVLADGADLANCRIIDISGTGARLEVTNLDAVPEQFFLVLSYDGRSRRQCSVVWRSEKTIGVEFVPDCPTS